MQDNETVILEPKPPQQIPEDFNPAYWQRRRLPLVVIGCGTLLVLVACAAIGGAAYLTFTGEDDPAEESVDATASGEPSATIFVVGNNPSPTNSQSPGPTTSPTESNLQFVTNTPEISGPTSTFTFAPPTRIPVTNTPSLTNTIAFTNTPTSTITATDTPPPTNSVPTNTLPPTLVPPTIIPSSPPTNTRPAPPSFTPQPTIPDGRQVRLFYDRNSFYAHNASPDDIPASLFRFEAVDETGADAGYSLFGTRWSEFYRYIEDGNCTAIEITQSSPWLRPPQCHFYNAILTPQRSNTGNFWLAREGVVEFRVLYDEVEIGRCPVGSGTCDVYVP